jgi:hypothetical protein
MLRTWIESGRIRVRKAWLEQSPTGPFNVMEVAEKYRIDFSDAIQLLEMRTGALAATAGASQAVFVSSDARLLEAARAEGFKVWNPETDETPPS